MRGVELRVVVGAGDLESDGPLDKLELSVGPGDPDAERPRPPPPPPPLALDGVRELVLGGGAGGLGDTDMDIEASGLSGSAALLLVVLGLAPASTLDSEGELVALGPSATTASGSGEEVTDKDSESLGAPARNSGAQRRHRGVGTAAHSR